MTPIASVLVDESVLIQTIEHLRSCLPAEGVGVWSGRDGQVTQFYPLTNSADDPSVRYAVHPQEWLNVLARVAAAGETLLGLVHSHPRGQAVPSPTDIANWYYPQIWCVIVSFSGETPTWRVYQVAGGRSI